MWYWRRMENIILTHRVKNEEVSQRVKEERNNLHTIKRRMANWIGLILLRNCHLQRVIEGKVEGRSDEKTRKKTFAATG